VQKEKDTPPLELIAAAQDLKERANALYSAGFTAGAMRKYLRATYLLQGGSEPEKVSSPLVLVLGAGTGESHFGDEHMEQVKALRLSLHLNLAAAALKLNELRGALVAAEYALELQPGGAKPLFRQAQAKLALHDHAGARSALTTLLKASPDNKEARRLLEQVRAVEASRSAKEKKAFAGMFDRTPKGLYSPEEVARQQAAEKAKTQFVRDREEEKRRGVQMIDTKELSRVPAEYQQREIDSMNEAMEKEAEQSKVPAGMTEDMYRKLLEMRTDGAPEEEVQREMAKMKREDMEETKKGMIADEIRQLGALAQAVERDRFKPDEVVRRRQAEYEERFEEIKKRVSVRMPMLKAHGEKQAELAKEVQAILEDETASEEDKGHAMRKMTFDGFKDLDAHLYPNEKEELANLRNAPTHPEVEQRLEHLLTAATSRRIEAAVDDYLRKEDEVLI